MPEITPVGQNELLIEVRATDASPDMPLHALVPASIFQRALGAAVHALSSARSATRPGKKKKADSDNILISSLKISSAIVGFQAPQEAVNLLKRSAIGVYHSDFTPALSNEKLARAIVKLGKAYAENYSVLARFNDSYFPIDELFRKQTERLANMISAPYADAAADYFDGVSIDTFDGRLGHIDYRGLVWTGHLVLNDGAVQIECVFDRSKGEDAFNPFGNKRVTVTGRSIYTGRGPLPERIEVISIEELPEPMPYVDIRGSLTGKRYLSWDGDAENIH